MVRVSKWDVGQWVSGACVVAGVIIEIIMQAHLGFLLITVGGLSWGISTKLKGK